jgi:uncharacterized protein (TIGR00304 family)
MDLTGGLLIIGLLMTLIGALMVYISIQPNRQEIETKGGGVIFIGPIPILFKGSRKWIITALGISGVILIFIFTVSQNPNIIGW